MENAEGSKFHSSTDDRDELADKIADALHIQEGKALILGIMSGFDISKKQTALIVYDGGQTDYLIKRFLVAKKVKGCTQRTCQLYNDNLRRAFAFINKSPLQCDHTDIQAFIASLIMRGCGKDYQQNNMRTLSSFYGWLTREEMIDKNIMLKIDPIKNKPKQKKAFTEMDVEKIRMACKTKRELALVEVLLSTGCRVYEAASLKIEQCQQEEMTIIGKGEKQRTVYLNARAQLAIQAYVKERKDGNPYLFPASINVGTPANKAPALKGWANWYIYPEQVSKDSYSDNSTLEAIIRGIGKRAGVKQCHPHRFRRTCATMALRRGMDVTLVQKMLGHESLATTQRYLDIAEEDLKSAHKRYVI